MNKDEREQSFEIVQRILGTVKGVLDRMVSLDDIEGCQQKLLDLIAVSGSASHAESVAKAVYDSDVSENIEILVASDSDLGMTNLKLVAQGKSAIYLGQSNYAERLGRNVSHAMNGMQSIVSAQKAEMDRSKYAN